MQTTKARAVDADGKIRDAVPDFAGCSRCIAKAKRAHPAGLLLIGVAVAFLLLLAGFLAISWTESRGSVVMFVVTACVVAIAALMIAEGWNAVLGGPHHEFRMNRKVHIHAKDPRVEMIQNGQYRWKLSEPQGDTEHAIVGPILQLRNGGYLFQILYRIVRGKPYNRVWMPYPMASSGVHVAFGSSIWRCTLHDRYCTFYDHRMRHTFALEDALAVIAQGGIGAMVYGWQRGTAAFIALADGVQETLTFLTATRDRRQGSPVGRGAREILERTLERAELDAKPFPRMPLAEFCAAYGTSVGIRAAGLRALVAEHQEPAPTVSSEKGAEVTA